MSGDSSSLRTSTTCWHKGRGSSSVCRVVCMHRRFVPGVVTVKTYLSNRQSMWFQIVCALCWCDYALSDWTGLERLPRRCVRVVSVCASPVSHVACPWRQVKPNPRATPKLHTCSQHFCRAVCAGRVGFPRRFNALACVTLAFERLDVLSLPTIVLPNP